ncbi:hypothetical protein SESBI_45475 [Sesbania bispinosa]|nr:hypothetical protein SESBI_45475 [Sesbania bispinosa]
MNRDMLKNPSRHPPVKSAYHHQQKRPPQPLCHFNQHSNCSPAAARHRPAQRVSQRSSFLPSRSGATISLPCTAVRHDLVPPTVAFLKRRAVSITASSAMAVSFFFHPFSFWVWPQMEDESGGARDQG